MSASEGNAIVSDGTIVEHRDGSVLRLVVNNPAQRNALTPAMLEELAGSYDRASSDAGIKVVVLSGEGSVFSGGYSVGSFPTGRDLVEHDELTAAADSIERCSKATLAVLNGDAIGAAFDLALANDFRIITTTARVGITPARFGLVYSWQGIQRAVDVLGQHTARRLLLTGELADAERALAFGAVDEVADGDGLGALEARWIECLSNVAPLSVSGMKHVLRLVSRSTPSDADRRAVLELRRQAIDSADVHEARDAFRSKRRPEFTGT